MTDPLPIPATGLPPGLPWAEIAVAWAVFAANVLSPGPNVFNTIAIALGAGRRTALAVVPAIALGVMGWAVAAVLGAAALFRQVPALEPVLATLGGALLLLFAIRYARRAKAWDPAATGTRMIAPREAFVTTLAVLATNPKALTTWLVLIALVPPAQASDATNAAMILGPVAIACAAHTMYALLFSTRTAAAFYARAGRWILGVVAVFFATLGVSLLWKTLPVLLPAQSGF
ncbi:MAG: LysE family transporter [Pseudomonadota bacterium]